MFSYMNLYKGKVGTSTLHSF